MITLSDHSNIFRMKNGVLTQKFCSRCKKWREISHYTQRMEGCWKGRLATPCWFCIMDKVEEEKRRAGGYKAKHRRTRRDKEDILKYRCSKCRKFKYEQEFFKDIRKGPVFKFSYYCKQCIKSRAKKKKGKK